MLELKISRPKISVVITAYNQENYVEEAINSVLSQTFQDFEILVVDDASTDSTRKKIKKYKDKVRCFFKKTNTGNASSKNTGIKNAKGEFIAFLDADDIWVPEKLNRCYARFVKNKNLGVIHSNFSIINLSGKVVSEKADIPIVKSYYPRILLGNFIGLSGTLIRRECFLNCGLLDEKLRTHEDWDLWIRLSKKYSFQYIDDVLFFYRASKPNQIKQDQIIRRMKDFRGVSNKAFSNDLSLSVFLRLKSISNWYFDLASFCFFRRQFVKCIELNLISILYMPLQFKAYFFFFSIIFKKTLNFFL